jgi:drug/metabolite transporter (DMT)-like permease
VWGSLTLRLTVVPIVCIAPLLLRPSADRVRVTLPLLVAVGLFDTAANLLYGASARHGLISVVSVLGSLYPVVLVVLARLFLKERISPPQLAGVAAALAGVALISAG